MYIANPTHAKLRGLESWPMSGIGFGQPAPAPNPCPVDTIPQCDPADSTAANCFRQAHAGRWCVPGNAASLSCRTLPAPPAPRVIRRVVIHALASPSMSAIVNRTATVLGRGTSAHYYVFRNGCIVQMVREANVAFHIGPFNRDSIGIEHADICNDPAPYTTQLYERSAELVRDILRRNALNLSVFGIHTANPNNATVIGHSDRVPNHGDPGPYWDWEYYAQLLQWNGTSAAQRPVRLVSMAANAAAAANGWQVRNRRNIDNEHCANRNDPYGATYWRAQANTPGDDVVYQFNLIEPGLYKTSMWWPRVEGANRETQVTVEVQKAGGPARANALVDQRRRSGQWNDIGQPFTFTVPGSGAQVTVRVRRNSRVRGWILADAVRVLRVQ